MIKQRGYKSVDLYQGEILDYGNHYVEMREHDYRFLLGLIEMVSPKKIVEVGAAAGITSAVILNHLVRTGKTSSCLIDIAN